VIDIVTLHEKVHALWLPVNCRTAPYLTRGERRGGEREGGYGFGPLAKSPVVLLYCSKVITDYCSNLRHFVFLSTPLGREGGGGGGFTRATHTVRLRLLQKLVVDFLFLLIELFC